VQPTLDDVRRAAERIAPYLHRTPVVTCSTFDRELNAEIFFKCENLQKVGAFKARGATNAVLCLDAATAARGVTTHSSGNHGAALAYAASTRDIPCVVVMPDDAPRIKLDAVRGYGAEVLLCPRPIRDERCAAVVRERGCTLIHPFEHPHVIAGQGTAALELLEEVGDLDLVIAPVGGGGLLSGTALTVKALQPDCDVRGAEPETVDDAFRSLRDGVLYPGPDAPRSWGDGLLTGLGQLPFAICTDRDVSVVTVSERAMLQAAWSILERAKLVVEPSAATVLAALRRMGAEGQLAGKRVGAILTGGNTDFRWLDEL